MVVTMLVFQISVPALANSCFQPNKLCRTVEEAKNFAAEHCLMQLGVGLGGEYTKCTPIVINVPLLMTVLDQSSHQEMVAPRLCCPNKYSIGLNIALAYKTIYFRKHRILF